MAEVVPNVQRDYVPSESESDNDEDFMAEENRKCCSKYLYFVLFTNFHKLSYFWAYRNSLTKEEIEQECEALHREAEMDVEQLRKMYSGQIEPEQNDKTEVGFFFKYHIPSQQSIVFLSLNHFCAKDRNL